MSQQEKEDFYDGLIARIESGDTSFGLVEITEGDESSIYKYPFTHSWQGVSEDDPRIEFPCYDVYVNEGGNTDIAGYLYILRRGEDLDWFSVELDGQGGGGGNAVEIMAIGPVTGATSGDTQIVVDSASGMLYRYRPQDKNVEIWDKDGNTGSTIFTALVTGWRPMYPCASYIYNWFHNNDSFPENLGYNPSDWFGKAGNAMCWFYNKGIDINQVIPSGTPIYVNCILGMAMYASGWVFYCNGIKYNVKPWGGGNDDGSISNGAHIYVDVNDSEFIDGNSVTFESGMNPIVNDAVTFDWAGGQNPIVITATAPIYSRSFTVGSTLSNSYQEAWFQITGQSDNEHSACWV